MKNITLVIPAKYEKESLPLVIKEIKQLDYNYLVVLKNNDLETISILENKKNYLYQNGIGYGNAIREGIDAIDTEYFPIFNADGSFEINEVENMINTLKKNKSDFLFGSRYLPEGSSDDDTFITFFGNKVFSYLGRILFKLPISDILYTFVVGKTAAFKSLNLASDDFRLCVELPIKANKNSFFLQDIASIEKKRIGGKKKVNALKDGFLILLEMIKLKFYAN